MGSILLGVGFIGSLYVWVGTCFYFFNNGDTVLGLIALMVPPADLVLPFFISPQFGFLGLVSVALCLIGLAIKKDK
jgi:hypothetical protein